MRSGHFDYDGIEGKLDYAATLGVEHVICPMLPPAMQTSLDSFKRAADQFNKWPNSLIGAQRHGIDIWIAPIADESQRAQRLRAL